MSFFEYEDTQLYYEERGEGKPFLIIHGWAIDHTFMVKCFEPVFAGVKRSYRRIYVDLPGMGLSKPGKVRNGDGMTEVLGAFMDKIAPGEGYYVGGNSFGSVVSRAMTAKYTDNILGLMLIAPAGDKKTEGAEKGIYVCDRDFMAELSESDRTRFMAMNANLTRETYARYKEQCEASVLINEHNDYMHHTLKGSFGFDINRMIEKHHFDKPTLILTGRYDLAVGYRQQLEWFSTFKKATYVMIDGAGHNIHIDQPEMFNKAVTGWIDQYLC